MTSGVLLLNATFEPLRVVSVFRAVCLVLEQKAEIVEQIDGQYIRSPSVRIPHPSVVRLVKYVKIPFKKRAALNNRNVLARDDHKCCYCGNRASTVDHVVPTSRGGTHTWDNVVAACEYCNSKKGNKLLSELRWEMRFYPSLPPAKYWLVVGWAEREQWDEYISALV